MKNKKKQLSKKKPAVKTIESSSKQSFFSSIKAKITHFFSHPLNAIIFKFSALMAVFYMIWATQFFQENVIQPVTSLYAKATGFVLQLAQFPVMIMNDSIGDMNFAISIKTGCDGIEGMAILLFAILVYPTTWSNRIKGLAIGFACLVFLNFIRIISLYFIGVHIPSLFDIMHVNIWQIIFIIVPLVIIYQWVVWINKQKIA